MSKSYLHRPPGLILPGRSPWGVRHVLESTATATQGESGMTWFGIGVGPCGVQSLAGVVNPTTERRFEVIKTKWACRNCGPLDVNDFYPSNRTLCKGCRIALTREWRARYEENFGRKYGLSNLR